MKKSIVVQTVITMILILVVVGFGVYALLTSISDRKSQVVVNLKDASVNVGISGGSSWGGVGSDFKSEMGPDGLMHNVWNMPDLVLTPDNLTTPAILQIDITNNNVSSHYDLRIVVDGVAYDQYHRFYTEVTLYIDGQSHYSKAISKSSPTFEYTFEASAEDIKLEFAYRLLQTNSSFGINQNIEVALYSQGG